jgi:hypothetical protein
VAVRDSSGEAPFVANDDNDPRRRRWLVALQQVSSHPTYNITTS